jgi:hypothetical protein
MKEKQLQWPNDPFASVPIDMGHVQPAYDLVLELEGMISGTDHNSIYRHDIQAQVAEMFHAGIAQVKAALAIAALAEQHTKTTGEVLRRL